MRMNATINYLLLLQVREHKQEKCSPYITTSIQLRIHFCTRNARDTASVVFSSYNTVFTVAHVCAHVLTPL